jgi:hypothetical protein
VNLYTTDPLINVQTLPDLCNFKKGKEKEKKEISNIFETHAKLFLAGIKTQ